MLMVGGLGWWDKGVDFIEDVEVLDEEIALAEEEVHVQRGIWQLWECLYGVLRQTLGTLKPF